MPISNQPLVDAIEKQGEKINPVHTLIMDRQNRLGQNRDASPLVNSEDMSWKKDLFNKVQDISFNVSTIMNSLKNFQTTILKNDITKIDLLTSISDILENRLSLLHDDQDKAYKFATQQHSTIPPETNLSLLEGYNRIDRQLAEIGTSLLGLTAAGASVNYAYGAIPGMFDGMKKTVTGTSLTFASVTKDLGDFGDKLNGYATSVGAGLTSAGTAIGSIGTGLFEWAKTIEPTHALWAAGIGSMITLITSMGGELEDYSRGFTHFIKGLKAKYLPSFSKSAEEAGYEAWSSHSEGIRQARKFAEKFTGGRILPAQLILRPGATLASRFEDPQLKLVSLTMGIYDLSREQLLWTIAMGRHGFGLHNNVLTEMTPNNSPWHRLERTIQEIPFFSQTFNILSAVAKGGFGLVNALIHPKETLENFRNAVFKPIGALLNASGSVLDFIKSNKPEKIGHEDILRHAGLFKTPQEKAYNFLGNIFPQIAVDSNRALWKIVQILDSGVGGGHLNREETRTLNKSISNRKISHLGTLESASDNARLEREKNAKIKISMKELKVGEYRPRWDKNKKFDKNVWNDTFTSTSAATGSNVGRVENDAQRRAKREGESGGGDEYYNHRIGKGALAGALGLGALGVATGGLGILPSLLGLGLIGGGAVAGAIPGNFEAVKGKYKSNKKYETAENIIRKNENKKLFDHPGVPTLAKFGGGMVNGITSRLDTIIDILSECCLGEAIRGSRSKIRAIIKRKPHLNLEQKIKSKVIQNSNISNPSEGPKKESGNDDGFLSTIGTLLKIVGTAALMTGDKSKAKDQTPDGDPYADKPGFNFGIPSNTIDKLKGGTMGFGGGLTSGLINHSAASQYIAKTPGVFGNLMGKAGTGLSNFANKTSVFPAIKDVASTFSNLTPSIGGNVSLVLKMGGNAMSKFAVSSLKSIAKFGMVLKILWDIADTCITSNDVERDLLKLASGEVAEFAFSVLMGAFAGIAASSITALFWGPLAPIAAFFSSIIAGIYAGYYAEAKRTDIEDFIKSLASIFKGPEPKNPLEKENLEFRKRIAEQTRKNNEDRNNKDLTGVGSNLPEIDSNAPKNDNHWYDKRGNDKLSDMYPGNKNVAAYGSAPSGVMPPMSNSISIAPSIPGPVGSATNLNIPSISGTLSKEDEDLKKQIQQYEGYSSTAYWDRVASPPVLTIGYGHNLKANPIDGVQYQEGFKITKDQAEKIFDNDYLDHKNKFISAFPQFNNFNLPVKKALIDMAFNRGPYFLDKDYNSDLKRDLLNGDFPGAAKEILNSDYAKKVKGRAKDVAALIASGGFASSNNTISGNSDTPSLGSSSISISPNVKAAFDSGSAKANQINQPVIQKRQVDVSQPAQDEVLGTDITKPQNNNLGPNIIPIPVGSPGNNNQMPVDTGPHDSQLASLTDKLFASIFDNMTAKFEILGGVRTV